VTTNNAILQMDGVRCTFERWGQVVTALDGVSFSIAPGAWVMLAGPNGAGKSTLLKVFCRQVTTFSGTVRINGNSADRLTPWEWARLAYYVDQDPRAGTAGMLTVFENLAVADPEFRSRRSCESRYAALLAPYGLADRLRQPVYTLSGGERQLTALLIAYLRQTPVVLLDEPLAALDANRSAMCLSVLRMLSAAGRTLVQVAHDISLATTLGERTVVMRDGRIVLDQCGAARDRHDIVACLTHNNGRSAPDAQVTLRQPCEPPTRGRGRNG